MPWIACQLITDCCVFLSPLSMLTALAVFPSSVRLGRQNNTVVFRLSTAGSLCLPMLEELNRYCALKTEHEGIQGWQVHLDHITSIPLPNSKQRLLACPHFISASGENIITNPRSLPFLKLWKMDCALSVFEALVWPTVVELKGWVICKLS